MGQPIPPGSASIVNLLDEHTLDKIAESTGKRLWKGFTAFGSASAGVLGIILIIRLAKLVIDTIIHGYALHSIYGWSLHLFGAIWSSVTNLLLHLARKPKDPKDNADVEYTPVAMQPPTGNVLSHECINTDKSDQVPVMQYKTLREYLKKADEP